MANRTRQTLFSRTYINKPPKFIIKHNMGWYKNPWLWLSLSLFLIALIALVDKSLSKSDCNLCTGVSQSELCMKYISTCASGAEKTQNECKGAPQECAAAYCKATQQALPICKGVGQSELCMKHICKCASGAGKTPNECKGAPQECAAAYCSACHDDFNSRKHTGMIVSGIFVAIFLLAVLRVVWAIHKGHRLPW